MPANRRTWAIAAIALAVGAVVLALFLIRPGGLSSRPVDSVPPLLSEPAGLPGAGLTLMANGLGPVTFGQAEDDVMTKLTALLGDPVEDALEPCQADQDLVRWVRWGNLTIALQGEQFAGYISGIYFPPDSPEMPIKTDEGVGLRASVDEMAAAYGDRFGWFGQEDTGFGTPVDAFGIDGFNVDDPTPIGLGGYVEGGREEGHAITFFAGKPCVDNGPGTESAGPSTPAGAAPTGVIAFHADPGGDSGLYVTIADGSGVKLVSGSLRGHPFAQWSPDGAKLAFLSGSFGVGRLMIVGFHGEDEHAAGTAQVGSFAWSPDGTRLAYEDAAAGGIWLVDAHGDAPPVPLLPSGHGPQWSPDGEWIAYFDGPEGGASIYRVRASGGSSEQLTRDGDDFSPRWSPDGALVAFTSSRDGNLELYVMAADGSAMRRLTHDPVPDDEARWSPDGAHLVYISYRDGANPESIGIGNAEVYTVDVQTGAARDVSNDPAWDGDPAWSPDGGWIAFTRRTDHGELYVMRPDGTDQRMLPGFATPEFNDCCPAWRPLDR